MKTQFTIYASWTYISFKKKIFIFIRLCGFIKFYKMKAKFIKHKNPRVSLGLDPLSKRDFESYDEFLDWLHDYIIPNYYNIPNGPELSRKIEKIADEEDLLIPEDLYNYILYEIMPDITIKEININKKVGEWDMIAWDLRDFYSTD